MPFLADTQSASLSALVPAPRRPIDLTIERFTCCGIPIATLAPKAAVDAVRDLALSGGGGAVHLCNAWTLALASKDETYADLLRQATLALADGAPVAWVGRQRGHDALTAPVRGPGLMLDVMRDGVAWGAKHYIYGSTPETIEGLRRRLPELVPGIELVALESPPFRDLTAQEEAELVARVVDSGAHYVWVGLGTPRQDQFVHRFAPRWGAVTLAVGAAFDFAAGTKTEAPRWLQNTGLEWTHRLASEPQRLWKRYLVGNTRFLTQAVVLGR